MINQILRTIKNKAKGSEFFRTTSLDTRNAAYRSIILGTSLLLLCGTLGALLGASWRWLMMPDGDFHDPKRHVAMIADLASIGFATAYASGLMLMLLLIGSVLVATAGYFLIAPTLGLPSAARPSSHATLTSSPIGTASRD